MLGISGRRWNLLPNFQHFTSFFFSLRLLVLLSPFCQRAAEPPAHPECEDSPAGSDRAAEAEAEGAAARAQRPCTSPKRIHLNKCRWFHPHRVSGCISLTHDCPAFLCSAGFYVSLKSHHKIIGVLLKQTTRLVFTARIYKSMLYSSHFHLP